MEKLYKLRYRIYIEELKKALPWADHEQKRLTDPYDVNAAHFMVSQPGGEAVGCARVHIGSTIPKELIAAMQLPEVVERELHRCAYVSKLMVERSLRGSGASLLLMTKMLEYGVARGAQYAVFHCNPRLCRLYERYGFQKFGQPFEMAHVGTQVCMINLFGDADHFTNVRSPLAEFVKRFRLSEERIEALRQMFSLNGSAQLQH
jgi:predicted GNAT family N-acyltransferase